jgi:RNA polymerase sigma-70 factor (ECF subfamily)
MDYQVKNKIEDIVKGCINNDRKSQKILFDTYAGRLMSLSYRYMGNEDDANEVLQEGFIKIFNKLSTYNFTVDIWFWMKRIIVNLAIDKLRERKRKRKITLSDQDSMFKTTDHDEMYDFELQDDQQRVTKLMLEAVAKLSPAYRIVFNMYVIEEYSHAEIASELGISEGTSKSNLFKAKANLKRVLKDKIEFVY